MEKHSVSRLSYLFAHLHLLSSDSFSSDLLSSNLSLLSASALLCFSSVHNVGSLTSKLPSITYQLARDFATIHSMGEDNKTMIYEIEQENVDEHCIIRLVGSIFGELLPFGY